MASSSAPSRGCVSGATWCDTFASTNSGWRTENKTNFFAQYDPYLGGTYRIGERTNNVALEPAPKSISDIAHDYSVQIDADVTENKTMPATDEFGVSCWGHLASDPSGGTSAFNFLVNSTHATIGLWDDGDGSYHSLATGQTTGVMAPAGATNHLTVQCLQASENGGSDAKLSLALNGKPIVSVTYANSTKNYMWKVGDKLDLLVSGQGSDVFFDNVAMTSKCTGDFC